MTNKTMLCEVMNKLKLSDSSFTERIISQKTVYLLQEFGLQTNYDFKWYNYGVYSRELADDIFSSNSLQISLTPTNTDTEVAIKKFADFSVESIKDPLFLELASSVRFLLKQNPFIEKEKLYQKIVELKPHLNNQEQFNQIYERLVKLD